MHNLQVMYDFPGFDPPHEILCNSYLQKRGWVMTTYGYARVSTNGQDLAAQDAELMAAGCAKIFREKVSGAKTDRAELARLIPAGSW